MRFLQTLSILFLCLNCFAQKDSSHFFQKIAFNFSIDYITSDRFNLENGTYCQTMGFSVAKDLKKRFSLSGALLYSNRAYYFEALTYGSSINPQTGFDTIYNVKSTKHFIEIPLNINWNFISKEKLKIYTGFALSGNYLIASSTIEDAISLSGVLYRHSKTHSFDFSNYNESRFILGERLTLGTNYKFTKQLSVSGEALFRIYQSKYETMISKGVNLALNYSF